MMGWQCGVNSKIVQPYGACSIAPVRREQAGFEGQQAQGVCRFDAQVRQGPGVRL